MDWKLRVVPSTVRLPVWFPRTISILYTIMASNNQAVSVHVEAVKNAFERVLSDDEFCLSTPSLLLAKDCVKALQGKLDDPPMQAVSHGLYTALLPMVDSCVDSITVSALLLEKV